MDALQTLADLYEATGQYGKMATALRAVLALNPVDLATVYYRLARALYQDADLVAAKRAVLQALEIAPGYRDAQRLLLQCVEDAE